MRPSALRPGSRALRAALRPLDGLATALLDLALPACCAACAAPLSRLPGSGDDIGVTPGAARSTVLCPGCEGRLRRELWPVPRIVSPTPRPRGLPMVVAGAPYGGVVRRLLSAYKDDDRRDLEPVLARALAAVLHQVTSLVDDPAQSTRPVLVPAPSSRAARRQRGDYPLRQLVVAATRLLSPPPQVVDALRVTRRVADQSGLDHAQRRRNLDHAYAVRARSAVTGRVVLVDDVVTTGATLAEAARALRAGGLEVVAVATVAATRRRTPPSGSAGNDDDRPDAER